MDKVIDETIEVNLNSIIADIRYQLKRSGWSKDDVQKYLILTYFKDGLLKLNDIELLGFQAYCHELPTLKTLEIHSLNFYYTIASFIYFLVM